MLQEEVRTAMLHYQWAVAAVAAALAPAGGAATAAPAAAPDAPVLDASLAGATWRPLQAAFFGCMAVLCEALAEYATALATREQPAGPSGAAAAAAGSSRALKPQSSVG